MANAPFTWGSSGPKALQPGGVQLLDGQLLENDGPKNYIRYSDAETGLTTGWTLGNASLTSNFPSGAPTFGSGASANLSLTASSSTPIEGTYSYLYSSSTNTTAGNFIASDVWTVDPADRAKVLTIKFYYQLSTDPGAANRNFSGTSSNSYGIAIYDVDASQWIMPAGVWSMTQSSGVGIATATFQTSFTGTQYRLVIFNANATGGSTTCALKLDRFYVGPQTAPIGAVITDWQSYTPTFTGFGTVSTQSFRWRRVGGNVHIQGRFTAGTSTSTEARITLPSGLVADSTYTTLEAVGTGATTANGAAIVPLIEPSSTYFTMAYSGSGANSLTKITGSVAVGAGGAMSFDLTVRITGWQSQVQMSSDTDTRVIAARMSMSATQSLANNSASKVSFNTVTFDSAGAFSVSATRYNIPVSGFYRVVATVDFAVNNAGSRALSVFKNGNLAASLGLIPASPGDSVRVNGSALINCVAGDYIEIYAFQNSGVSLTIGNADGAVNYFTVERLSGPAVVAATESVAARSGTGAPTGAPTSSMANVTFSTSSKLDTHSAFDGTAFTAPISGIYRISAQLALAGTYASSNYGGAQLTVNGSIVAIVYQQVAGSGTATTYPFVTYLARLNAGDIVRTQAACNATSPSYTASGLYNYMLVERVGN